MLRYPLSFGLVGGCVIGGFGGTGRSSGLHLFSKVSATGRNPVCPCPTQKLDPRLFFSTTNCELAPLVTIPRFHRGDCEWEVLVVPDTDCCVRVTVIVSRSFVGWPWVSLPQGLFPEGSFWLFTECGVRDFITLGCYSLEECVCLWLIFRCF